MFPFRPKGNSYKFVDGIQPESCRRPVWSRVLVIRNKVLGFPADAMAQTQAGYSTQ